MFPGPILSHFCYNYSVHLCVRFTVMHSCCLFNDALYAILFLYNKVCLNFVQLECYKQKLVLENVSVNGSSKWNRQCIMSEKFAIARNVLWPYSVLHCVCFHFASMMHPMICNIFLFSICNIINIKCLTQTIIGYKKAWREDHIFTVMAIMHIIEEYTCICFCYIVKTLINLNIIAYYIYFMSV